MSKSRLSYCFLSYSGDFLSFGTSTGHLVWVSTNTLLAWHTPSRRAASNSSPQSKPSSSQRVPLGFPLAIPLLLKLPCDAPPLPPLGWVSPPTRLLSPEMGRAMGAGVANLVGAREEGGFSTKDVSVVIKVSSPKSGRET